MPLVIWSQLLVMGGPPSLQPSRPALLEGYQGLTKPDKRCSPNVVGLPWRLVLVGHPWNASSGSCQCGEQQLSSEPFPMSDFLTIPLRPASTRKALVSVGHCLKLMAISEVKNQPVNHHFHLLLSLFTCADLQMLHQPNSRCSSTTTICTTVLYLVSVCRWSVTSIGPVEAQRRTGWFRWPCWTHWSWQHTVCAHSPSIRWELCMLPMYMEQVITDRQQKDKLLSLCSRGESRLRRIVL